MVEVPDDVSVETLDPANLPGWEAEDQRVSRAFGDRWLAEHRSTALLVPSLVARPFEQNVLINPAHRDSACLRVAPPVSVTWDARLFRSRRPDVG